MNAPVRIPETAMWAVDSMGGALLDRLVYLARFGPPGIVVAGSSAAGRADLCGELARRLGSDACRVRNDNMPAGAGILLVQEAGSLSDVVLAGFRASGARLVLFGSPELAARCPEAHVEHIPNLDQANARSALRRWSPGKAVSDEAVERTLRATGSSQPETAQALAAVLAGKDQDVRPRIGLPGAHMAALVAVAGLIAAALLMMPGLIERNATKAFPLNLPIPTRHAAPESTAPAPTTPAEPVPATSAPADVAPSLQVAAPVEDLEAASVEQVASPAVTDPPRPDVSIRTARLPVSAPIAPEPQSPGVTFIEPLFRARTSTRLTSALLDREKFCSGRIEWYGKMTVIRSPPVRRSGLALRTTMYRSALVKAHC